MRGKTAQRIVFGVLDFSITVLSLTVGIIRLVNGNDEKKRLYDIACSIICWVNLGVAVIYTIVGGTILWKLRSYYPCLSRTTLGFVILSTIFITVSIMRFISLIYKNVKNDMMQ